MVPECVSCICVNLGSQKENGPDNKGKAIPLEAWRGPEFSRRLRQPDFETTGT